MRSWMIAFSFIVAIVCHLPMLMPWHGVYLLLPASLLLGLFLLVSSVSGFYRTLVFVVSGACLGAGYGIITSHYLADNLLDEKWNKQTLQVTGVVSHLPRVSILTEGESLTRFILKLDSPQKLPTKIQLSWVKHKKQMAVVPGGRYQLTVRLVRPQQLRNPNMRDSEFWFVANKIGAKGYVVDGHLLNNAKSVSASVLRMRSQLSQYLQQQALLSGKRFIPALLVGDKSLLTNDDWQLFTHTGTIHLLIISGLHVGIIAGVFWYMATLIGRFSCVNQYYWWRWFRLTSTLLALWGFVILSGAELAATRAAIMASVLFLFVTWRRQNQWFNGLIVAWFVLTLVDPMVSWSAGFYFSFGIVLLLLLSQQGRYLEVGRMVRWLQPQTIAFLFSSIVLLQYGREASLISPIANLVAIPLLTLLILPLAMLSMFVIFLSEEFSQLLLGLSSALFDVLLWLLYKAQALNQGLIRLSNAYFHEGGFGHGAIIMAIFLSILLLVLLPRCILPRTPLVIFLLALLTLKPISNINNNLQVIVFDVGQGLSLLVKGGDSTLLYDTGPAWSHGNSVMQRLLQYAIKKQRISNLDWLVVSHGDSDHSGGAPVAIKAFKPKSIIAGEPERLTAQVKTSKNLRVKPCQSLHSNKGQWQIKTFYVPIKNTSNNHSCIMKISWGKASVLLTGDIDREVESYLLKNYREDLKADVLIVPHHGSKTSSSIGLLNWAKPKVAIVSAGYMNRFNHPVKQVLSRYERRGIAVLNTAYEGAVSIDVDGLTGKVQVTSQHRDKPYFWDKPLKPLPQWLHHGDR